MCVCVWHSIGSASRHHTNLRMISLEPSEPEPAIFEKKIPEKWPLAESRGKKFTTSMLFYGENLAHFFSFLKRIFSQNIKQFTTNINFEHLLKINLLNLYNKKQICVSVLLCIRTVNTLEPNRLHIRNQHDEEGQH